MNWRFLLNVIIKGLILFVVLNLLFVGLFSSEMLGKVSAYNVIFPGRARFPFGENPTQSYNLSLYNMDAMFASHELTGRKKSTDEYRVFVIGDSSVWGTLLRPEETLAGQLNALNLSTKEGKQVKVFNIGYPTVSLLKDAMFLEAAMPYEPDLVVWLVTLEAFPIEKQLSSPIVENNLNRIQALSQKYGLDLEKYGFLLEPANLMDRSIVGQRRNLADWIRLQVYGVMWAATGVDQEYFENYSPAQRDFEEGDSSFHGFEEAQMESEDLAFEILGLGEEIVQETPLLIVNEPMMISTGLNSDSRYNFFFPRWAYDSYRVWMEELSREANWEYVDLWDLVPEDKFTNSAIHLSSNGSALLADEIGRHILEVMTVTDN